MCVCEKERDRETERWRERKKGRRLPLQIEFITVKLDTHTCTYAISLLKRTDMIHGHLRGRKMIVVEEKEEEERCVCVWGGRGRG